jgi:hypothetical protein
MFIYKKKLLHLLEFFLLFMVIYCFLSKEKHQVNKQIIQNKIQILNNSLKEKMNVIQKQALIIQDSKQNIVKKENSLYFYKKKIKLLTKEKEAMKKDLFSITNALIEKENELQALNKIFS